MQDLDLTLVRELRGEQWPPRDEDRDLDYYNNRLPTFEFLARLGVGGQCKVFLARVNNEYRAIKILKPGARPQERARFLREARILGQLQHPHIIRIHRCEEMDDVTYLVMDYIPGTRIDEMLSLGVVGGLDECLMSFSMICRAVDYAHRRGVIHRDLKPSNVLITSQINGNIDSGRGVPFPIVLDFGLAKVEVDYNDNVTTTTTGQIIGTLAYMSPEQALEQPVREGSDIYSLGVLFYQVLTGCMPYPVQGQAVNVLSRIVNREPAPVESAYEGEEVPKAVQDIVLKALQKRPHRRYRTAAEMADDLDRARAGRKPRATGDMRVNRLLLRAYKYRKLIIALSVVLALGLAAMRAFRGDRLAEQSSMTAQIGLQMAHFSQLGSAERDNGRVEKAASYLTQTIELAAAADQKDPVVRRFLFGAHQKLAEMYYEDKKPDLAESHCKAAVALSAGLVDEDPENIEWQRLQGFAHVLQARSAVAVDDWVSASQYLDQCVELRTQLVAHDQENDDLREELAFAHAFQGRCYRQDGMMDLAKHHYMLAYDHRLRLFQRRPESDDRAMSLMFSELKLAAWHLDQRTATHDDDAREWLDTIEMRLDQLEASGRLIARQRDVGRLRKAVRDNKDLIRRRRDSAEGP